MNMPNLPARPPTLLPLSQEKTQENPSLSGQVFLEDTYFQLVLLHTDHKRSPSSIGSLADQDSDRTAQLSETGPINLTHILKRTRKVAVSNSSQLLRCPKDWGIRNTAENQL